MHAMRFCGNWYSTQKDFLHSSCFSITTYYSSLIFHWKYYLKINILFATEINAFQEILFEEYMTLPKYFPK